MTSFTPEQLRMLLQFALPTWPRPGNMYRLIISEWEEVANIALEDCHNCGKVVYGTLPDWTSDGERDLEPFEHWWRQRLKNAYRKWVRRRKLLDRPPSIDGTLRSIVHGEDASTPLSILEAEETERRLAKLRLKDKAALRATLEHDIPPTLQRVTSTKAPDYESRKPFRGKQRRIDREIEELGAPGYWMSIKQRLPTRTPEERAAARAEVKQAIADIAERKRTIRARVLEQPVKMRAPREVPRLGPDAVKAKKRRKARQQATVNTSKRAPRTVTRRPAERAGAAA
jgi:hypothetical protein